MDFNQLHWLTFILQASGSLLMVYGFMSWAFKPKTKPENETKPESKEQAEDEIRRLERELRRL